MKPSAALLVAIAGAIACGCRAPEPAPAAAGGAAADADRARLARIEERLELAIGKLDEIAAALDPSAAAPQPSVRVEGIETGDSPALGPEDATVTIIGFADFECPYCAGVAPTMEALQSENPGRIRRVFKHFPMPFHKQALLAHKAALAAEKQGKFWEMHQRIFEHQDRLDAESLRDHAREIGLDIELYDAFVASSEGIEAIKADRLLARKLGVLGVPAFFINGRFVAGAQPPEVFRQVIEEELAAAAER